MLNCCIQLNYLISSAIRAKRKLFISSTEQEQLDQENLCLFFLNNLSATTYTTPHPIPTDMPFEFKRLQFSVRLGFAMSINKAQGQSLK
ncbi:unnamed protein product, partial [Rotaria magnacalcarata]